MEKLLLRLLAQLPKLLVGMARMHQDPAVRALQRDLRAAFETKGRKMAAWLSSNLSVAGDNRPSPSPVFRLGDSFGMAILFMLFAGCFWMGAIVISAFSLAPLFYRSTPPYLLLGNLVALFYLVAGKYFYVQSRREAMRAHGIWRLMSARSQLKGMLVTVLIACAYCAVSALSTHYYTTIQ